jgi:threonine dehydrogenase-like Zn-dependent dehydrogenase
MAEKIWGDSPAGFFGYSHMLGGYSGGQAEYLRVPFADVGPIKVPKGLRDEQVLFLSDIFPTGYMAPDFCNIDGACGEGRDRSFVRHHPPCYAGGRS